MVISKKSAVAMVVVLLVAGVWFSLGVVKNTAKAYLYGYPLVLMDLTRQAMTSEGFPVNNFRHIQRFPDHTFRNVVRPNNDTLYSIAWLDLSKGPLVLDVPDTDGRQYVIPFMDAWTNVFSTVGKGSTGTAKGSYMIAGPNWDADVNTSIEMIRAPTNMVWVIGRIQTNGNSDIPNVIELQKHLKLTPLNSWLSGERQVGIQGDNLDDGNSDPNDVLKALSSSEFFSKLAELMGRELPLSDDKEIMGSLESVGIVRGDNGFGFSGVNVIKRSLMEKTLDTLRQQIAGKIEEERELENGWAVARSDIGVYGNNYSMRAAVAMIGLGALPPAEASYPNTGVDSNGLPLDGSNKYTLHFPKDKTPPVNAFWSLTMYDESGFLIENPIDRYAIGDRDALTYNEDGSLDIHIQKEKPENSANWLPAPDGKFAVTMRLYLPKKAFLDGSWKIPGISKNP